MSIKIQINSLDALERLIGGDNELEIDIRQSVVESFTKKHLKAIAKTDIISAASQAVSKEIRSEFFEIVNPGKYNESHMFSPTILKQLKEELHTAARSELYDLVKDVLATYKIDEVIKERLVSSANYITDDLTSATLERRLNKMVDDRLKQKLGL